MTQKPIFPVPCLDALLFRMTAGRGRKITPKRAHIPLWGVDPVPIPYNRTTSDLNGAHRASATQPQRCSWGRRAAVIPSRIWPPPTLRGLVQYPREGGAQTPPLQPQRVCKGDTDLMAHLFRSIHLRGTLQGAFCCQRRVHQDRRRTKGGTGTPSPLSERRGVHLQGKPAPTAEPAALRGFGWGEGCSPPPLARG